MNKHSLKGSLVLLFCFALSTAGYALSLPSWLQNRNQKAMKQFQAEAYQEASENFARKDWQAAAQYKAKDYQQALSNFQADTTTDGLYNLGNTLAHLGQYQAAIQAYDKAIQHNGQHEDAIHNRKLIQALLEEQNNSDKDQDKNQEKDQEKDQEKNQDQDPKNDQDEQQNDKQEQNSEQSDEPQQPSQSNDPNQKNDQENNQQKENSDQTNQPPDSKENKPKEENENNPLPSDAEKNQALRLIPDDPGGLLREKFWRDHWRRMQKERT